MNWLDLFRPRRKTYSAWQIELTTRCPLRCRMCIREGIRDWQNADMKIENFRKLKSYFKNVEAVVLEGWGESLLHKNLVDAVRLVKEESSKPGFVTSGKGLDRNYISELIDAGVDFIGFSFAGASKKTHESIRVNSDFESLIENIRTFNELKAVKKLEKPNLHIVYLMLRENIFEVPELLKLARDIGIGDVVLTNLIHITNEWQDGRRVFTCNRGQGVKDSSGLTYHPTPRILESSNPHVEILKAAEIKAKELGIRLRRPSLSPIEVAVCEENPLGNLYISADGEVSPCVYLNPPVPSPFKRIFCGEEHRLEKVSFGNIFEEPFETIWNNRRYAEFRDRFAGRKRKAEEAHSFLFGAEKLKKSGTAPSPEPPGQCKICHKMLGV